MVVGQERCWAKVNPQVDGLVTEMCPMERSWNPLRRVFGERPKPTTLNEAWLKRAGAAVEDYLLPLIPSEVGIELVGRSVSKREPYEEPTVGITARLWRVYPRGWPAPAPKRSVQERATESTAQPPDPVSVGPQESRIGE
jgi:hypothetical protein